ncbi:hypothetical protein S83_018910 [Arachis hypogaea]
MGDASTFVSWTRVLQNDTGASAWGALKSIYFMQLITAKTHQAKAIRVKLKLIKLLKKEKKREKMQGAKNTGQSIKEKAANVGASAQAGLEKTKATVQEKAEKMSTRDPIQKQMATQKKEHKTNQAEMEKQAAYNQNAAHKEAARAEDIAPGYYGTATHSTTGQHGHPTGGHQMSALPGHGTGQPTGQVTEGVIGSHPIGTNTGTTQTSTTTTARNTRAGVNPNDPRYGHGTGGSY